MRFVSFLLIFTHIYNYSNIYFCTKPFMTHLFCWNQLRRKRRGLGGTLWGRIPLRRKNEYPPWFGNFSWYPYVETFPGILMMALSGRWYTRGFPKMVCGNAYGRQKLQPRSGSEKKDYLNREEFLANLHGGVQGTWRQDFILALEADVLGVP